MGPHSIRLMFSIADIDAQQQFQNEENQEGPEEVEGEIAPSYPIRVSFSITKVRTRCMAVMAGLTVFVAYILSLTLTCTGMIFR